MIVDGLASPASLEALGLVVTVLVIGCAPNGILSVALGFAARRRPPSSARWNDLYFAAFVFNVCGLVISTFLLELDWGCSPRPGSESLGEMPRCKSRIELSDRGRPVLPG